MAFNFISPVNITSYGMTGFNLCRSFFDLKIPYSLFPIFSARNIRLEPGIDIEFLNEAIRSSFLFDTHAPSVRLWHQFDMALFPGRGPRIGYPIFELDRFNEREKYNLSQLDGIFVTCEWAKQVLRDNDINLPAEVIPLGVDREIFCPMPKVEGWDDGTYRFINIGKLEVRKGHDIICDLFNKAFEPNDNVELLMCFHNLGLDEDEHHKWRNMYKMSKMGHRIRFFNFFDKQAKLAQLMNNADCLFQPSRAEGWNLPILECMSCDKPIITTNYSGHTEFCTNNNAHLVEINELEVACDNRYFFGQGNWAKIGPRQKDELIEFLRHCYKNSIRNNPEGVKTAEKFSWNNSAQMMLQKLSQF